MKIKEITEAIGSAPFGVIVQTPGQKVIVGDNHQDPIPMDPRIKAEVEQVGDEHGYWGEGTAGADFVAYSPFRASMQRGKGYNGSWDRGYKVNANDWNFLYTVFANVDQGENQQSRAAGANPKDTIFNNLIKNPTWQYPGVAVNAQSMTKFLKAGSTPQTDFLALAQQEATPENVKTFLDTGEREMFDNYEANNSPMARIAKSANGKRDDYLIARREPGVYFAGAGHLLSLSKRGLKMIDGSKAE
jgi:hypothetical protein